MLRSGTSSKPKTNCQPPQNIKMKVSPVLSALLIAAPCASAFSSVRSVVRPQQSVSIILRSTPDENDEQQQQMMPPPGMNMANAPPPVQQSRMDPLMASLTRIDPETAVSSDTSEREKKLLYPALGFAAIGFLSSVFMTVTSMDTISAKLQQSTEVLSQPPVMNKQYDDTCRGLCSSQDQQLEDMRSFMNKFAKDKGAAAPVAAVKVQTPAPAPAPVVAEELAPVPAPAPAVVDSAPLPDVSEVSAQAE